MKTKKLKIISLTMLVVLMLGCFFKPTIAQAKYYEAIGKISWYNGEGKMGYDGKILNHRDCATKKLIDNPPAGTIIYVNDDTTGTSYNFYKWDVGNFPSGVVLDLTLNGWKTFGHNPNDGYFKGRYFHR